ncbi:hypothetical protein GS474_14540 [Rhodococcus hoagii]|nr:hypothetical protein [Prescottella equi]NKS83298.1 hypothetical protein [Prescottella equi]
MSGLEASGHQALGITTKTASSQPGCAARRRTSASGVVGQPRERDGDGMPGDADFDVAHARPGFSPVHLVSAGAGANHPIESSGSGVGAGGMEVASDRY